MFDEGYHKNFSKQEGTDIFNRYFEGETQKEIALDYGISIRLIHNIVHNKIYRNYKVSETIDNYTPKLEARKSRARARK